MKWRLILPTALVAVSCVCLCLAQNSAVITIEVKDQGQAAIAGAQINVAATSPEQAATEALQTDQSGTVSLDLPTGTYDLSVKMAGFRSVTKRLVIANTDSQTIAIVLQVGGCPPGCPVEVAATAPRLQYILLNDASRLTHWPGGTEQQVNIATQFLKQVVMPGSDVGSLVNFSDNGSIFLGVANSTQPHDIAKKLVREGRGGTAVYDSVVSAATWLSKQESSDRRKMVFLFSDGDDDASSMSLKDAIKTVQVISIPVFVIAPSSVEDKRSGKNMKQFADATGGHAYFVDGNSGFDFALLKHDLAR